MAEKVTRIEASNANEDFYRHHTRLTVSSDRAVVTWSIPDRLLRREDLRQGIVDELVAEHAERGQRAVRCAQS